MHEWLLILHLITDEVSVTPMSEAQCRAHIERLEEAGAGAAVADDGSEVMIVWAVCAPTTEALEADHDAG